MKGGAFARLSGIRRCRHEIPTDARCSGAMRVVTRYFYGPKKMACSLLPCVPDCVRGDSLLRGVLVLIRATLTLLLPNFKLSVSGDKPLSVRIYLSRLLSVFSLPRRSPLRLSAHLRLSRAR